MSFENPAQIIRSWNLQGSFSSGQVVQDKLVPRRFPRIRTPFINTWREEALNTNLDWGSQAFSFYLPESLRVISSMFLRIPLPALGSGAYKKIPGFYAVKTVRFLSAGQESYSVEVGQYLRDYVESLDDEAAEVFCNTYLGYTNDAGTGTARVLMVPILLPNSSYMSRSGKDTRGHGVWPCYTGTNRLEMQITMGAAVDVCKQADPVPVSLSGNLKVMIHQLDMTSDDVLRYSDVRGAYSVITRRFTEITNGWINSPVANTKDTLTQNQPIGCVTELFCIAVPSGTTEALREIDTNILPTRFTIISDSVTQKTLNTPEKVQMELWSNGFIGNKKCNRVGRLCFASHAAEAENMYTGGFNMQLSSQISIEIEFAEAVDYRIFAVQLQRVTVNSLGLVQASLD